MPIYEYRCPEGHTFELLQRMSDAPPSSCELCGASPVNKVLYPAAVHFKGSGFYSTDYGRGSRKQDQKEAESTSGDSGASEKTKKKDKKKAAET